MAIVSWLMVATCWWLATGAGLEESTMTRETERGGPCRPIETEVNRESGSTYSRVSFLHTERKAMRITRVVHYE